MNDDQSHGTSPVDALGQKRAGHHFEIKPLTPDEWRQAMLSTVEEDVAPDVAAGNAGATRPWKARSSGVGG